MRWRIERNVDGSFSVFCSVYYIEEYERAFKAVVKELVNTDPSEHLEYDTLEEVTID